MSYGFQSSTKIAFIGFQPLLINLSIVRIAFLLISYRKILFFRGTFNFHRILYNLFF
uniref:Uncharacterized protein n=1 Tax=Arundo donax TaxID=35708 RepID=A0A0A9M4M4_ARUDO